MRYVSPIEATSNARIADAIVIGGGIVGTSAAFHLASLGLKKVVLCERRTLAAGATGKSAAHIQVVETVEAEARLTIASLPYYIHWDELVGAGSCDFAQMGYLRLGEAQDAARAKLHIDLLRAWGVDARFLSVDEVREIAPYLKTEDVGYGHYQPVAGYASSTGAAVGFAARAEQLGADIREHTTVLGIDSQGGHLSGVRTTNELISAPIAILAAGAWSLDLLRSCGLELPVISARTQVAQLEWPDGATPIRFMSIMDLISGSYFSWHGADARRVVAGLSGLRGYRRQRIDDLSQLREEGDTEYATIARDRVVGRIPGAAPLRRGLGWAGPVTSTPDRAPIIDEHPGILGLYFSVGCNGRGFKGAPALGRALAEWAVMGAPRVADLSAFNASRFGTGRLVQSALPGEDRGSEYQELRQHDHADAC